MGIIECSRCNLFSDIFMICLPQFSLECRSWRSFDRVYVGGFLRVISEEVNSIFNFKFLFADILKKKWTTIAIRMQEDLTIGR